MALACRLAHPLRLAAPAPLAILAYEASSTLAALAAPALAAALPGLRALAGAAAALLVYALGARGRSRGALILATLILAASWAAGEAAPRGWLWLYALGVGGVLASTGLRLRCEGVQEGYAVEWRCRGPCLPLWLAAEAAVFLAVAAAALAPARLASAFHESLPRLAGALPPDTRDAWLAASTSPVTGIILFTVTLAVAAWLYNAAASWARAALLTDPQAAAGTIREYWEREAERAREGKTWYHALYARTLTLTLLAASDLALIAVLAAAYTLAAGAADEAELIAAVAGLSVIPSIILFFIARRVARALTLGNPRPLLRLLTALTILLAIAAAAADGPQYLGELAHWLLQGGEPPASSLDERLRITEVISRLAELAMRILAI